MTMRKANATAQKPDRRRPVPAADVAWTSSLGAGADCCALTSASPHPHAAVDHKVDAGHIRALVGGEEQRHVRHILRFAEPTQEGPVAHFAGPALVLELPPSRVAFDEPRGDRVDTNAVLAAFERELAGHPDDRRLVGRMRERR